MTSINKDRLTLRLPKELSKAIKQKAKEIGVSANCYILMILSSRTAKK